MYLIHMRVHVHVGMPEEMNESNEERKEVTNLQLLVNLLLDRSAHLRRVDSHYSRAQSVGVFERVSSIVKTSSVTLLLLLLVSTTRLTNTDIGAHTLSRHREAVPRDDEDNDGGEISSDDATTPTKLLHGSPYSREVTAQS